MKKEENKTKFQEKCNLVVIMDLFKTHKKWDKVTSSAELVKILANINRRNVESLTKEQTKLAKK